MSLNLYFWQKGINIQEIRDKISNLYDKKQSVQEEIEQLEDEYYDAKLPSLNIIHNLYQIRRIDFHLQSPLSALTKT
jgi:ribosomal protein S3